MEVNSVGELEPLWSATESLDSSATLNNPKVGIGGLDDRDREVELSGPLSWPSERVKVGSIGLVDSKGPGLSVKNGDIASREDYSVNDLTE